MSNNRYEKVVELLLSKKGTLSYTEEDSKLILKLWDTYWKKREGNLRSSPEVLAAAVLWQHPSNNYLWDKNIAWTQKALAELFSVKAKTIGDNARQIRRLLKIELWDDRFCKKDVAAGNPFKQMAMTEMGFIMSKDQALKKGIPFAPLKKEKEDYYYDGMDFLDAGDFKKAKYYFKKALDFDDEFVDAYNGIGSVYWFDDKPEEAKEWFQKAFELTKKHYKDQWPAEINWGVLENRQFLRSIQYYGLALWRLGNIEEALELFKLLLKLNKNDNQGARYVVAELYAGNKWEDVEELENDREREEKLLEKQNRIHQFWQREEDETMQGFDESGEELWEEGAFSETLGAAELEQKRRTFYMGHDEEMNFNCRKCDTKISAHNKDWHNHMCDECFDKENF